VRDADHLVVRHADRLGQLAQEIAGRGARAADHVHVEVHVHRIGAGVRVVQFLHEAVDPELRPHLPHRVEVRALLDEPPHDLLALEHAALADLDHVLGREVLVELVHLVLPASAAGDARIHRQAITMGCESQCVSRLMWPTLPRVRSAMGLAIA
jgi:hypothetical protein